MWMASREKELMSWWNSSLRMGVKNLWDILESCKKTLPLHHLQLSLVCSHFILLFLFGEFLLMTWWDGEIGCRNKRVCVDLSCWVVQLQTACKAPSCAREKVYLRSLFHRLRALIALNCSLIFVTGIFFFFPPLPGELFFGAKLMWVWYWLYGINLMHAIICLVNLLLITM